MDVVVSRCAGIDIGKAEVVVCLRIPGSHGERQSEVRTFRAFAGRWIGWRTGWPNSGLVMSRWKQPASTGNRSGMCWPSAVLS